MGKRLAYEEQGGSGQEEEQGLGSILLFHTDQRGGYIVFFFTFLDFGTNLCFVPKHQNRPFAGYITFLGGFLVIFLFFR